MRLGVVQIGRSSAVLLMLMIVSSSNADVVISIQNVSVFPGNTALVGVFASSDAGNVISGFNLPMDFNSDGLLALPSGFVQNATPVQNALYANTALDTPASIIPANVDWIPTGSGSNATLGTDFSTLTKLFDLAIDVGGSVPTGTVVPIEIRIPAAPLQSLFNIAGPSSPTVAAPSTGVPVFGSISVVPEPGSFWLILVVSSMCALWQGVRWWRGAAQRLVGQASCLPCVNGTIAGWKPIWFGSRFVSESFRHLRQRVGRGVELRRCRWLGRETGHNLWRLEACRHGPPVQTRHFVVL